MKRVKMYIVNQKSRGPWTLTIELIIVSGLMSCIYIGFIR